MNKKYLTMRIKTNKLNLNFKKYKMKLMIYRLEINNFVINNSNNLEKIILKSHSYILIMKKITKVHMSIMKKYHINYKMK